MLCRQHKLVALDISIHAPSRERPSAPHGFVPPRTAFQSTFPRGSDIPAHFLLHSQSYFNPRSLTGATVSSRALKPLDKFQSTLPRGSDDCGNKELLWLWISIHAPSRERRQAIFDFSHVFEISIHAPSQERPQNIAQQAKTFAISIHAPSRERRSERYVIYGDFGISIHAPSRERPILQI